MKSLIMLLFIFSANAAHLAHAHLPPGKPCWALLLAQPLNHTPQRLYPMEMEEAGQIIKPDDLLPTLDTGFYIYLVTSNGEILLAPRYNVESDNENLATHKSLLEMYRRHSHAPESPDIVAAGEFQIAFEDVTEIRNKSGNFRGDKETLDLAVEILTMHGLPINTRTKIIDVSGPATVEYDAHTPHDRDRDQFRIQELKEVHDSIRGRMLSDLYRRMYRLLRETFPGAQGRDVVAKLMDAQGEGARITGEYNGFQTFYYPLQSAYTADGLEYGIWATERFPDHGGRDGFDRGAPVQVDNVILGLGDKMKPSLRAKWRTLSREFRDLSKLAH